MPDTVVPQSRPTIVDVARAAGVSRQTVSNALNSPEKVASDTLERVRHHISELAFTPHATARQLRRQRASAYGFAMNPSSARGLGHVLDEFLVELTTAAPDHGSHLVTFAPRSERLLADYQALLATGLVDGFIFTDTHRDDPRPPWLLGERVPFVSFGRLWDRPDLGRWVDVDGRSGMRQAVLHLAEAGYRQIGFLGWPSGSPVGDDRRDGWLDGLAETGLLGGAVAEESVQDLTEATTAAHRVIDRLGDRPALVCASDLLALGAMRAARSRGLEPGPDIGVVGFDDSDVAQWLHLTTVRQPIAQAAAHAWRLLFTSPEETDPVLLSPTLTVRSTSVRDQIP